MRYPPTHAAPSDSAPFKQRRPRARRIVLSAAIALVFGLTPAFMLASPAAAVPGDLTITNATAVEGTDVVFTLTYTGAGATYNFSTAGLTATAGTDYTAAPTPATFAFANGSTTPITTTVHVATTDDTLYEGNETFTLNAVNSVLPADTGTATGTILDNDDVPTYTLTATTPVTEADLAKSTVTATLSAASGMTTVVTLSTVDGTAEAGSDYTALPPGTTITIPAGQTTGTQDIAITNDGIKDTADTETFTVNASATNVAVAAKTV